MLELEDLTVTYGDFRLGPLDLRLDAEVLAVLGPSGSGKSTLLSLIAGLTEPDDGVVRLDGRSLLGRPPEARGVGFVFQDGALFPHMTARENVAYAADDPGRVDALADRLEVGDLLDRRPPTLSGGERRRVALARALAAQPDALLLDEPLSNLDVPTRERLRAELVDLFGSLSVPVVYVTHDRTTARALADRVAVVRDGRVVQVGPVESVFERPTTPFVARFTGANCLPAAAVDGASGSSAGGGDHGGPGLVAVRPEHVRLVAGDAARVVRVTREDAAARVTLAVDGATVEAYATDPPAVGERVGVEIPPERCAPLDGASGEAG